MNKTLADLEANLRTKIIQFLCDRVYNCSDSNNKQYPHCEDFRRYGYGRSTCSIVYDHVVSLAMIAVREFNNYLENYSVITSMDNFKFMGYTTYQLHQIINFAISKDFEPKKK